MRMFPVELDYQMLIHRYRSGVTVVRLQQPGMFHFLQIWKEHAHIAIFAEVIINKLQGTQLQTT